MSSQPFHFILLLAVPCYPRDKAFRSFYSEKLEMWNLLLLNLCWLHVPHLGNGQLLTISIQQVNSQFYSILSYLWGLGQEQPQLYCIVRSFVQTSTEINGLKSLYDIIIMPVKYFNAFKTCRRYLHDSCCLLKRGPCVSNPRSDLTSSSRSQEQCATLLR